MLFAAAQYVKSSVRERERERADKGHAERALRHVVLEQCW